MMTGFMFIGAGNLSETLRTCDKCRKVVEGSVFCGAAPQQPAGVMPDGISDDAIKTVWRAAMTSAHNVCVNRSNRWNDDDGPDDRITEANECAKEIAHWREADEGFIAEIRAMLAAQQQGGAA